ncbi:MAG: hypothetical protein ACYCWW_20065, partial [Deltaproteobacteria bacterium]
MIAFALSLCLAAPSVQLKIDDTGSSDRVATGDLTVGPGEHVRNVTALRGNVELAAGAVARDVTAIGGSVHLSRDAAAREATAIGGSVVLDPGAQVERDATAIGGSVEVAPTASVGHDAVGIGGGTPPDSEGHVGHDRVSLGRGLEYLGPVALGLVGLGALLSPFLLLWSALLRFVVYFGLALIIHAFWPQRLEALAAGLWERPGASVAVGLASLLGLPLLALLLVVTIIGIPLAVLEALGVAAVTSFAFAALALVAGRALPWGKGRPTLNLALGVLLVTFVTSIPVL